MKIKNLLYITPNFPLPRFPERGAFAETLVRGFSDCGVETDVIAPTSLAMAIRLLRLRKNNLHLSARAISRPVYISLSNKIVAGFDTKIINEWSFSTACSRAFNHKDADAIIGKFLFGGAISAVELGNKYGIPAFADMGESRSFKTLSRHEKRLACKLLESLSGIYCVSERLAEEVIALGADPSKILVSPNEVDSSLFRPMNQQLCRKKIGIPEDVYLVSFVGHFIDRKGPLRVMEAIEQLGDSFKGIFLGRGSQIPTGRSVLHAGPVPHWDLPIWLNASDVFCLPTRSEGHCNAIEEAKACGLPIVASDIDSVSKQLEGFTAHLVNPNNVNAIRDAILKMRRSNYIKREELETRQPNTSRAEQILKWIEWNI